MRILLIIMATLLAMPAQDVIFDSTPDNIRAARGKIVINNGARSVSIRHLLRSNINAQKNGVEPWIKLTDEQISNLASLYNADDQEHRDLFNDLANQMEKAQAAADAEAVKEIGETAAILTKQYNELEVNRTKDVARILDRAQLETLREVAISHALIYFGGFDSLIQTACTERDISMSAEQRKKIEEIGREYDLKLRELQAKTLAKVLDSLPEDARDATTDAIGIKNLHK